MYYANVIVGGTPDGIAFTGPAPDRSFGPELRRDKMLPLANYSDCCVTTERPPPGARPSR